MPSPAGAGILTSFIILLLEKEVNTTYKNLGLIILTCFIAYLLISSIPYLNFKEIKIKKSQVFYFLVFFILGLTFIGLNLSLYLIVIFSFYIFFGPVLFFKNNDKFKKLKEKLTK